MLPMDSTDLMACDLGFWLAAPASLILYTGYPHGIQGETLSVWLFLRLVLLAT